MQKRFKYEVDSGWKVQFSGKAAQFEVLSSEKKMPGESFGGVSLRHFLSKQTWGSLLYDFLLFYKNVEQGTS